MGNYDPFLAEPGDEGFCGNFFFGLTWQIYRFIGNDGLLYWVYDAPDTIRQAHGLHAGRQGGPVQFLEKERLLAPNTDTQMAGPRAYGYVSGLPGADHAGPLSLKQLWGWAESQETVNISPAMYKEFVLPQLAELAAMFGLVYYGCCEPVHDRLAVHHGGHPQPPLRLRFRVVGPRDGGRDAGQELRVLPETHPGAHERRQPAVGPGEAGHGEDLRGHEETAAWRSCSATCTPSTASGHESRNGSR